MEQRAVDFSRAAAPSPWSDPLEAMVSLLCPQTVLSKVVTGKGQWSFRKPRFAHPSFCLILDGHCWLSAGDADPQQLHKGDFLLLAETPGFVLASDPRIEPIATAFDHSRDSHYGHPEAPVSMRMLGGYFQFDQANAHLIGQLLPPSVLIRADEPGAARLRGIVELITEEADADFRCRNLVLQRLVEVLLIEAWRLRAGQASSAERGLIGGLSDPALAVALREVHADVARDWTVERLARAAGMSRAVFAERFSRTVGMPPMSYVMAWRVAVAKELLRSNQHSLAQVAVMVGYRSASAFTGAFTRVTGCSPSEFVRRQQEAEPCG